MGFAGELTTIGLPEVFQNVAFNRLTGVLTVSERVRRASILFEEGVIKGVRTYPEAGLDYVAIAQCSNAAPANVIAAAASKTRRRRTLRDVLAKGDNFEADRYDAAVSAAVREELILLFSWKHASFVFEEDRGREGFEREQLDSEIHLDPQSIAMEAARRVDEWEAIAHRIESERDIFLPVQDVPPEESTPEIEEIIGLLDGTRDLASIIQDLPHGRFYVLSMVADLAERGYVDRATLAHLSDLAQKAEADGDLQRAVAHYEAALDMGSEDMDTRLELVRLYELCGRRNDAAREYKRLADYQERNGDLEGALDSYRSASALVPYETEALERIVDIHDARGDKDEFMSIGTQLAEVLTGNRLLEEALEVYLRLAAQDHENLGIRESVAATYIKLHEPKKAARELLDLANRSWDREDLDRALHYYRSVLAVDHECEEATARISEIDQRRARLRRKRHSRRLILAVATILAMVGAWQGGREWYASRALTQAARAALGGVVNRTTDDSLANAILLYSEVANNYPHTSGSREAETAVRTLLLEELDRLRVVVDRDAELAIKTLERLNVIHYPEAVEALWRDSYRRLRSKLGFSVSEE